MCDIFNKRRRIECINKSGEWKATSDIYISFFLYQNLRIFITQIPKKFVAEGLVHNKPALVEAKASNLIGSNP